MTVRENLMDECNRITWPVKKMLNFIKGLVLVSETP